MAVKLADDNLKPTTPLSEMKGVGKANLLALQSLGVADVAGLAFHLPYRYDDFTATTPLGELRGGETASVVARLVRVSGRRSFRRRMNMTEAVITDGHDELGVLWFSQPYLAKSLVPGAEYRFAGKVTRTRYGVRLVNPLVENVEKDSGYLRPLMPVYPLTTGVSQHQLRKLIARLRGAFAAWPDPMPEVVLARHRLPSLADALVGVHFPESWGQEKAARRRLAFDELLRISLAVAKLRALREEGSAPEVPFDKLGAVAFVESLPFKRTEDQAKAAWEAIQDMERRRPMNRLLDGDVGSGKTAVAAIAMRNVAAAGFQSALMAPTEILAKQHFHTLARLFAKEDVTVALWTNAYKRAARGGKEIDHAGKAATKELRSQIADGAAQVVVGTHALVEATLSFCALALAVVDEQHRFGVSTRRLLTEKSGLAGLTPHLLSMTATPIPRSLALTIFGDLDLSLLKEKPAGRQRIATRVCTGAGERARAYDAVRAEVAAGRQAFVICPLIDPSDTLGSASVSDLAARLRDGELAGIEVGVLHGRLKADEKERVMREFSEGRLPVLVSTSVVEVGVDVPNATVMAIEGAERFGLAQLHQFRGRVGRGRNASACYLLPSQLAEGTEERLRAFASTDDGFALAEMDLKMRGPGDILGERQSGFPALKAAVLTDLPLLALAKEEAERLTKEGTLDDPANAALKKYLAVEVGEVHLE